MMRLLADAGSTKITWVLQGQGIKTLLWSTPGFNPNYADASVLVHVLHHDLAEAPSGVEEVCYYGTGCGNENNRLKIKQILLERFPKARIEVGTDILGAARALFCDRKGIACILGTGANSCLYDGHDIVEQAVSLGYLVGDEGSGCYIGRKVARAYFYGWMPLELQEAFRNDYPIALKDFIERVYHQPEASKYLAGFTLFAGKHKGHPFIQQLVEECFEDFMQAFVLRYEDCRSLPVGFVGSVAYHFRENLRAVMALHQLTMGEVKASPLESFMEVR